MKRDRAPRQQKTTEQWMALEAAYLMDNYPSDDQYKKLGSNLQLTPMQVREWFCKRRKKSKVEEAAGAEDQQPNQESGQAPANGAVQARKRRRTRSGSSASQGESNRSVLAVRVIAAAKELLLSQVSCCPGLQAAGTQASQLPSAVTRRWTEALFGAPQTAMTSVAASRFTRT